MKNKKLYRKKVFDGFQLENSDYPKKNVEANLNILVKTFSGGELN